MAIFALAMVSTARDYKMALEVFPSIQNPNPIYFFGTNEIACIPILFALSMLTILLILQMGADLLSGSDLIRLFSPMCVTSLIRGGSLLGLLVSCALCISVVLIANRQLSETGTIASENIAILVAYLRSSIVIGLIAMLLALVVVAVSLISPISQTHISRNITASPS